MYNCFEFEKLKEDNIYMSPELFTSYFIKQNNEMNKSKKSNIFSIGLLSS